MSISKRNLPFTEDCPSPYESESKSGLRFPHALKPLSLILIPCCKYYKWLIAVWMLTLLCSVSYAETGNSASPTLRETTIRIMRDDFAYKLDHSQLIAHSETVTSDSLRLLRDKDYTVDYQQGIITFLPTALLSEFCIISYNVIPDFLLEKYYLYEMTVITDSLSKITGKKSLRILPEDNRLQISGSKTFSLTFSNQESFDLKQSLYIKLQGELSKNLKIEGQLSDSQSPLSPEGDSRELSSIDQVFLKIYGKQYAIAFGDLEWEFKDTHLMDYAARFEGINLWYQARHGMQAAIAANGGKSTTNIFQGIDGKQGPYYLSVKSSTQSVLVVPGSESISINGTRLQRGSEYSIDYSEGAVTFKTLITSNSRIAVDFQYTDDYYRQSMYLNSSLVTISDKLKLRHHIIWQVDDKSNPLQWTFSPSDQDSLSNAGDGEVWGQGVIEVEPGKGQYRRMTNDNGFVYYEYVSDPADTTAIYQIYFSYVGYGKGDYEPFAPSKYIFKGIGLGSYLPLKRLIAPSNKANIGLDLAYKSDNFEFTTEGMLTSQDKNTLSSLADADNHSLMTYSSAIWHPQADKLQPRLSVIHKYRLKNSYSFSNQTSYDDSYLFSALPSADSLAQNQINLAVELDGWNFWKQSLTLIYKDVRELYLQKAIKAQTSTKQYVVIPSFDWFATLSHQVYPDTLLLNSQIYNHNLVNEWQYKLLKLRLNHLLQQDIYDYSIPDSTSILRGRRYQKTNPTLTLGNAKTFNSQISYSQDQNELRVTKKWEKTKYSTTWQYNQLFNLPDHTMNFGFTHRTINQQIAGAAAGTFDKSGFDLLDYKSNHQMWDKSISLNTSYQLNQLEFFPKIRDLQYVGDGLGMYDSTGVAISEGDYDWVYVNSGESTLSSEINANASLFFRLSDKITKADFWKRLQTENSVSLTENTIQKSDLRLYLLFPDEIFQDDTTLYGRQTWQNTLWYDILRGKIALKMQLENSRTLDNRYQSLSKTQGKTSLAELEFKQVWGLQIRSGFTQKVDTDSRYNSKITAQSLDTVFFKNLSSSAYTQLTISRFVENGDNQSATQPYTLLSYKINPSVSWFIRQKHRVSSSLTYQYNDRSGSEFLSFLPDKRKGSLVLFSLQTQYKISSFTSGFLEYNAKSYPQETILHELKMEFRAEL